MEWNEFVEFTDETAIYPEAGTGSPMEIAYVCLGLAGEVGELLEIWGTDLFGEPPNCLKRAEELGDVFFYLARGDSIFQTNHVGPVPHTAPISSGISLPTLMIGNAAKKLIRDGLSYDRLVPLKMLFDRIFLAASLMLEHAAPPGEDFTLPQLLDQVVDKVKRKAADE